MADADPLAAAVAELYAADPDEFTERRKELAALARAAGDRPAAKAIAALRKPTRSAWVVNRLVRADPSVIARLMQLGDELRASEAARDGARLRELSLARRKLLDKAVRDALAGLDNPPAVLREDVTATLTAAILDRDLATELAAGSLVQPVQRSGFGAASSGMAWSPVPASAATERDETAAAETAAAETAAAEAAEAKRERVAALAAAELAAAQATEAAEAAARNEGELAAEIKHLERQLAEARDRLRNVRQLARQTAQAQRAAQRAAERLR